MTDPSKQAVLDALRGVHDPCSIACNVPMDIVEMGLVRDVACDADRACKVTLVLTAITCFQVPLIEEAIEQAILAAGLARTVEVIIDHDQLWSPEMMAERTRMRVDLIRRTSRRNTDARPQQWKDEVDLASASA
jgi:metal-sulfur cluster biosynthetic enzyme